MPAVSLESRQVQARCTRLSTGVMPAVSLESRQVKADLCVVYKMMNNLSCLDKKDYFAIPGMMKDHPDASMVTSTSGSEKCCLLAVELLRRNTLRTNGIHLPQAMDVQFIVFGTSNHT